MPNISIVVPVYEEEENIALLYSKIRKTCDFLGKSYEIVFVDDGSYDKTYEILKEIHREDSRLKVLRFRKNYGQTAAMAAGFQFARGDIIISMDGDLQNDPTDIPCLIDKLDQGFDVVCGWRKDRKDKLISRRIPSVVANWLISLLTGVRIHDNGCSLKAYRSYVIKKVPLYSEMHRFIPAMASLRGARITEIVVNHHPRKFGYAKYGISRVWKVFLDLFVVKMLVSFFFQTCTMVWNFEYTFFGNCFSIHGDINSDLYYSITFGRYFYCLSIGMFFIFLSCISS